MDARIFTLPPHPKAPQELSAAPCEPLAAAGDILPSSTERDSNASTYVLGSLTTPAQSWIAAALALPNAVFLQQDDEGQWRNLHGTAATAESTQAAPPAAAKGEENLAATPTEADSAAKTAPEVAPRKAPRPYAQWPDSRLVHQVFLLAAWGEDASQKVELEALLKEASHRSRRLLDEAEASRRNGRRSHALWREWEPKLKRERDPTRREALFEELLAKTSHGRSKRHLTINYERLCKFLARKRSTPRRTKPGFPKIVLGHQPHPNSLRHLPAHNTWEILIDETGRRFEDDALALDPNDRTLGRLVALAVPKGLADLPELPRNFHASEDRGDADKAIAALLETRVGLLGLTVQDPLTGGAPRWFAAINTLMRWVLRLLPLPSGRNTISFFIENRGVFDSERDLLAVQQLLESEFRALDKARFEETRIELQFIDKSGHPLLGYVDAAAHAWGGSDYSRLKRTGWLRHCFIRPNDRVMERIYYALDGNPLAPEDWLAAVTAAEDEPEHSLLHTYLRRLGEQMTTEHGTHWRAYLELLREQLATKRYRLGELAAGLDWLQRYEADDHVLPPLLRLQWLTAGLAKANHIGAVDLKRCRESLDLARLLKEEDAPSACEADLRVAVTATNAFEFDLASRVLDPWREEEPKVCGLLNWGKVHSSLGQHAAFRGDHAAALAAFDRALAAFDRLSDRAQAARERDQTANYRLTVLMDAETDPSELRAAFRTELGLNERQAVRELARSGNENRYRQHLLLRLLVTWPDHFADWTEDVLSQEEQWQSGDGHPWPLILAYRGWLLAERNQTQARTLWADAITCAYDDDQGPTMQWIGEVLRTLGASLQLMPPPLNAFEQSALIRAPLDTLNRYLDQPPSNHAERVQLLRECLPFNFH